MILENIIIEILESAFLKSPSLQQPSLSLKPLIHIRMWTSCEQGFDRAFANTDHLNITYDGDGLAIDRDITFSEIFYIGPRLAFHTNDSAFQSLLMRFFFRIII